MSPEESAAQVAVIQNEVGTVKADIIDLRQDVKDIRAELHEIRTDLARRPAWPVVALITFLTAVSSGSIATLLAQAA